MAAAFRRVAARELEKFLLHLPLDFDFTRPARLGLRMESSSQSLCDEAATHSFNGSPTGLEYLSDILIGTTLPQGLIG
jgi:hypothetical protein